MSFLFLFHFLPFSCIFNLLILENMNIFLGFTHHELTLLTVVITTLNLSQVQQEES